jgi:hypothetical protein
MSDSTKPPAEDDCYSWQERFRDCLHNGSVQAVAEVLRQVDSLGLAETEALANLFEAGTNDHRPWALLYPRKLVFAPRGRLAARRGLPKKNKAGQIEKLQEESGRGQLLSEANLQGTESSPEQLFCDALSKADAGAVATVLRESKSLGARAIDALAYMFDVTTKDHPDCEDLRRHKLVFKQKRRGAPKDLERLWVTDPQIAAFVEQNTDKLRKVAVSDATEKFRRSRSTIFAAMARNRSSKDKRD